MVTKRPTAQNHTKEVLNQEENKVSESIFSHAVKPNTVRAARAKKEFKGDEQLLKVLQDSFNNSEWYSIPDNYYAVDAEHTVRFIRKHTDYLGYGLAAPKSGWHGGKVTFMAKVRKEYES